MTRIDDRPSARPAPLPSKAPSLSAAQRNALARRRLRADQNGVLIAGGMMAGIHWVLLLRLINGSPPLAFPRWLFFIFLFLAVTGSVIPVVWYLNRRFSRLYPPPGGVILRQAMWFGVLAVTLMWLQMTRALNGAIAFFLILAIVVIEFFLRVRERTQAAENA